MKIHHPNFSIIIATLLLQACGGAADTNSNNLGAQNSAIGPHTIVITRPVSDSIENLGGGVYRANGKVIVTDGEGNGIAGVKVNLKLIDSIIARNTLNYSAANPDYISGNVVHDTGVNFATAQVFRNGTSSSNGTTPRGIMPGDHVLILGAENPDKRRYVSDSPNASQPNDLSVLNSFLYSYPTQVHDPVEYIVGASLLGAFIKGTSGTVDSTVTDENGIATFYVTYPNSINYINTGCGNSSIDTRHLPLGSAGVYVVAWVNDNVATIDNSFCFNPIAGGDFSATPSSPSLSGGSSSAITVTLRDGGDKVEIPFATFSASLTDDVDTATGTLKTNLSFDSTTSVKQATFVTNEFGSAVVTVYDLGGSAAGTGSIEFSRDKTNSLSLDISFTP